MDFNKDNYLFFYGHTDKSGPKKCLSNWYPSEFYEGDIKFYNSEQYMMFKKAILFNDIDIAKEILEDPNPKVVKAKGRLVKNFKEDVWIENAREFVYKGCFLKFSQNNDLEKFLVSTVGKVLVEASPYDKIWGIGINIKSAEEGKVWKGSNWLGECLMRVRDDLV